MSGGIDLRKPFAFLRLSKMTTRETPSFARSDAVNGNRYRPPKVRQDRQKWRPSLARRAELHPMGGGPTLTWMEAGDPPVHRDRTGAARGSLG